ncbi:MAG: competence type IV pilus minor pilin ComGF, partial [Enterococcus sp.]
LSITTYEINGEVENAEGQFVTIVIKKNKHRIVKSQSNGYQPLLTGVNQFVCQENNHGVDFIVTFTDGKQKEGTWIFK